MPPYITPHLIYQANFIIPYEWGDVYKRQVPERRATSSAPTIPRCVTTKQPCPPAVPSMPTLPCAGWKKTADYPLSDSIQVRGFSLPPAHQRLSVLRTAAFLFPGHIKNRPASEQDGSLSPLRMGGHRNRPSPALRRFKVRNPPLFSRSFAFMREKRKMYSVQKFPCPSGTIASALKIVPKPIDNLRRVLYNATMLLR